MLTKYSAYVKFVEQYACATYFTYPFLAGGVGYAEHNYIT